MAIDLGNCLVVVAWHNQKQIDEFCREWRVKDDDPIIFQQDKTKEGCAITKNKGIKEAYNRGAEVICVLDDDCFPESKNFCPYNIRSFIQGHIAALQPQAVQRVIPTTTPNPRGMPYYHTAMKMPVAASMGFWTQYPDFDAIAALQLGPTASVKWNQRTIFGEYFPFCGMNFAFRREWAPEIRLVDIPRFDDIFFGWCFQKVAYEKKQCFNLCGPVVRHSRQSNIWQNLREEAPYLEINETIWETIDNTPRGISLRSIQDLIFGPGLSSSVLSKTIREKFMPVRQSSDSSTV